MLDYFVKGGPVMYPLLLCSMVGLAIIIDRLIALHRMTRETDRFLNELRQGLTKRDIPQTMALCENDQSPAARVLRAGLRKYRKGRDAMERAIEDSGRTEVNSMARGMLLLSTAGRLGPLLGFLGTITGLIKAFNALSLGGAGDQGKVALGVSEAMITTAAGLIIAIPIQVMIFYLNGRIDRLVSQMERNANYLLDLIDDLEEEEIARLVSHKVQDGEPA